MKWNKCTVFFFFVVYPELCNKKDSFLLVNMTLPCILWMIMNVVDVYSVYYNTSMVPVLFTFLKFCCFLFLIAAFLRWVKLVQKQNGGRFQASNLSVEEHTFLQYIISFFMYATAIAIWILAVDAKPWQTLNATTLIFYVGIGSFFATVIIGKDMLLCRT